MLIRKKKPFHFSHFSCTRFSFTDKPTDRGKYIDTQCVYRHKTQYQTAIFKSILTYRMVNDPLTSFFIVSFYDKLTLKKNEAYFLKVS